MAKLTRAQRHALENALHHLQRAYRFIMSDPIAVCRRGKDDATTTAHFTRADGATMYEIDRVVGSDLCGLEFAMSELVNVLRTS